MKWLVLTSRIPYPLEKGDKLRVYHQIKHLSERHDVVLCCLSDASPTQEQKEALAPLVSEFHVLKLNPIKRLFRLLFAWSHNRPFQVVWFTENAAKRRLKAILQRTKPDGVFCQLIRCAEYVKDCHEVPKTLDYMDALSAGMHRRSHQDSPWWRWPWRWLMMVEGNRLARYESRMFDYFDAHTIISTNDRLLIPHRDRDAIRIVPNGVALSQFSPASSHVSKEPRVVLFTGNMSYPPNVDAAQFLAQEIMPRVQTPGVHLVLAGAEPKPVVEALASERVTVTGWVDDIADEYRRADLFVAPLRMGTGLQNKVLEAMSTELPCILSPHAFSPLGLPSEGHAVVCQSPVEYAEAIDRLLAHPEEARKLGISARRAIQASFSWQSHGQTLEDILEQSA